jgi:hypothetical protein
MPIRTRVVNVAVPKGTKGRFADLVHATFSSPVNWAEVAINGFKLRYDNPDHHIKLMEVDASFHSIEDNVPTNVRVFVHCQLADRNEDDPYSGSISVLVIADVQ